MNIPQDLIDRPQWVVWRREERGGKLTKVPYCAATGKRASSKARGDWTGYRQADAAKASYDGIGYVFAADDPYCGIDLDDSLDADGQPMPWAAPIIADFPTYAEVSPSGRGVKLFFRGVMPAGDGRRRKVFDLGGGATKSSQIELYDRGRYFTVTGNRLAGATAEIADGQGALDRLLARMFPVADRTGGAAASRGGATAGGGLDATDDELIRRAMGGKNGAKFRQLWERRPEGGDASADDLSLVNLLAFWCGPDAGRIDRLFRQSALYREKWDRADYSRRTIERAMSGRTEFYRPGTDDDCEPVTALQRMAADQREASGDRPADGGASATVEMPPVRIDAGGGAGGAGVKPAAAAEPGRPVIANVDDEWDEEEEKYVKFYRTGPEILAELRRHTGEWPRLAGGVPFAVNEDRVDLPDARSIHWITDSDSLMAWVGRTCNVRWASGDARSRVDGSPLTPPTKGEFYSYVANNTRPSYEGVEFLPHTPSVRGIYYIPARLPKCDLSTVGPLDTLIGRLNPETEMDRWLLLAALLTPGWGGPAGARPAFVFSSDHGRGAGKTATAETLAGVWGGAIGIAGSEDFDQVRKRLLGDDAISKRVCLIDNIKGRLSGSDLESMITGEKIDGWRPYHGQASRANLLTWYLTTNSPSLSRDLAERSIIIKIGPQKHSDDFVGMARDFISEHRAEIISQCMAYLGRERRCTIAKRNRDRWHAWQEGVLTKLDFGNDIARLVIDRRPDADSDSDDADEIFRCVLGVVQDFQSTLDVQSRRVFITRRQLYGRLIRDGVIDKNFGVKACVTWVRDKCGAGAMAQVKELKHSTTRGWLFTGDQATSYTKVEEIPETFDESKGRYSP